jgi:hypothetical protein
MTFKQGKFYDRKGNVVPLEFGNKDQIAMIERVKTLQEGAVYFKNAFPCPCGTINYKSFKDGKMFKCHCGAKYVFSYFENTIPVITRK